MVEMALLRYLKPANGLPNPKGSLSTMISPDVIAEMNKEVKEASRSIAGGNVDITRRTLHLSVHRW